MAVYSHLEEFRNRLFAVLNDTMVDLANDIDGDTLAMMESGYSDVHGGYDGVPYHTNIYWTGALEKDMNSVPEQNGNVFSVTIGTDIPYAEYVHEPYPGSHSSPPRPWLEETFEMNGEDYIDKVKTRLSEEFS